MKTLVVVCLLACAAAFPQGLRDRDAKILRYDFKMSDDGQFQYDFETSNGIIVDAAGENRQIGDAAGMAMRGSYSYTSPEGIDVNVEWEADEKGFRAVGPQVPVVPEYVKQLLNTPVEPQPDVPVSSPDDASVGPVDPVVSAFHNLPIFPILLIEDAPAEVVIQVPESVDEIVEPEIEDAPAPVLLQDTPAPAPVEKIFVEVEELAQVEELVFEVVETQVEDAPEPAPIEDAPAPTPLEDDPVSFPIEDAFAPVPVEDAPAPAPIEETPAPVSVEDDPVQAPAEIALPIDIVELASLGTIETGDVSGFIDVTPVSASADNTPDSIQDAIASALREDSPAIPSLSDIADKAVPSSEFIVLDA